MQKKPYPSSTWKSASSSVGWHTIELIAALSAKICLSGIGLGPHHEISPISEFPPAQDKLPTALSCLLLVTEDTENNLPLFGPQDLQRVSMSAPYEYSMLYMAIVQFRKCWLMASIIVFSPKDTY